MNTVNGLPAHPLFVHAVVVLVPLAALLAAASALWPAARVRLGVLTPLTALLALISVPFATSAGEALQEQLPPSSLIDRHAELGDGMILWAAPLFRCTLLWWALHIERFGARLPVRLRHSARARRVLDVSVAVLMLVLAAGAVVLVYRIGDSGARAVWG